MKGETPHPRSSNRDRNELGDNRKIGFYIESDFNKKEFFKKRVRYLVDSRLKEWGSGGRDAKTYEARIKELQLQEIKASQITQQIVNTPLRTATVRYMAKSYLRDQKEWNKTRESLIADAIKQRAKKI